MPPTKTDEPVGRPVPPATTAATCCSRKTTIYQSGNHGTSTLGASHVPTLARRPAGTAILLPKTVRPFLPAPFLRRHAPHARPVATDGIPVYASGADNENQSPLPDRRPFAPPTDPHTIPGRPPQPVPAPTGPHSPVIAPTYRSRNSPTVTIACPATTTNPASIATKARSESPPIPAPKSAIDTPIP